MMVLGGGRFLMSELPMYQLLAAGFKTRHVRFGKVIRQVRELLTTYWSESTLSS